MLIKGERYETKDLNEKANKVEKCQDAASIIRANEEIIKAKKNTICIAYRQGIVFKMFKEKENFIRMMKKLQSYYID